MVRHRSVFLLSCQFVLIFFHLINSRIKWEAICVVSKLLVSNSGSLELSFPAWDLGNSDHLFRYSFSYQDCQKFWRSIGNWFNAVKECERKEHETNNAEQKNANLPQTCNLSLEVFSCKMTHYFFVEFVILSDVLILISILFFTWNKLLAL